jgi:hypothetical protein
MNKAIEMTPIQLMNTRDSLSELKSTKEIKSEE